jgi:hypothetical protein
MARKEKYDVGMIRDFLEHLMWELRIAVHENQCEGGRINPELTDQLKKYIQRRDCIGLLEGMKFADDLGDAEGLQAMRDLKRVRLWSRIVALDAIETLQVTFEEALRCAERNKEFHIRIFKASDVKGIVEAAKKAGME